MTLLRRIARRSVAELTRAAAVFARLGLALIATSVLWPRPLPVILAMSVGHGLGGLSVGCYLLAVLLGSGRPAPAPPGDDPPR